MSSGPGSPGLIIRQLAISLRPGALYHPCQRPPTGTLFSYSISSSLQMTQRPFQAEADRQGDTSARV